MHLLIERLQSRSKMLVHMLLCCSAFALHTAGRAEAGAQTSILEVLRSKDYIEISQLDQIPDRRIRWSAVSGEFLYIAKAELPYIYLAGWLEPGYRMQVNGRAIPSTKRYFELKLPLQLEPNLIDIRLYDLQGGFISYRLSALWLKLPAGLSVRVQDGAEIVDAGMSLSTQYRKVASVQLYRNDTPTTTIDLSDLQPSSIRFRTYAPLTTTSDYEQWAFYIYSPDGTIASELKGTGLPPAHFEWQQVHAGIVDPGRYTYQLVLTQNKIDYKSSQPEFFVLSGKSVLSWPQSRSLFIEPRIEIGALAVTGHTPLDFAGAYSKAVLKTAISSRLIVQADAYSSIPKLSTDPSLSLIRAGSGIRFHSEPSRLSLSRFTAYKLDVLLHYSRLGLSTKLTGHQFDAIGLSLSPELLLTDHHLSGSVEWAVSPNTDLQKVGAALRYHFHFQPMPIDTAVGIEYVRIESRRSDLRATLQVIAASINLGFTL